MTEPLHPALAADKPMKVADFASTDTHDVIDMWDRSGVMQPGTDPMQDIFDCLASGRGALLVGKKNDQVAATVMCGHDDRRGWLYYIAVDPAHQGSGLGAEIVRAGEEWVSKNGFRLVSLMVEEHAPQNVRFYLNIGYTVEPRFRSKGNNGISGVRMTKPLMTANSRLQVRARA